jgi:sirohydrochlorin ferrochelatase
VLLAHGTRDHGGALVAAALAGRVGARLCFADVGRARLAEVLAETGPAVVLPAFLSAGYHVHVDLPAQLAAAGRPEVILAEPLCGHPALGEAAADRLVAAGWRADDAVLLAAAGSSDARAGADVARAADALSRRLGCAVEVGYVATGAPRVAEVVGRLRAGGRRVAAASWLLAPGVFQQRLDRCGADLVAEPLGVHPRVIDALNARFAEACRTGRARRAAA